MFSLTNPRSFSPLCSPILPPFHCASFPLLCVIEFCIHTYSRIQRKKEVNDEEQLQRCEERLFELLQRDLKYQLRLVGFVYECGDELDSQEDEDIALIQDFKTPLLG
ncbi:hypothetical protein P3X46_004361 [Hevea brasiliensis]|uniref:Uncharacterized protein n=1 Tax=Hevea brasiliensis TaxID=3981 RepID=A0ABQ9MWI2_HEVBR|nr:hypothetical protein P3X46_004361 [Hevea brasiliensis]